MMTDRTKTTIDQAENLRRMGRTEEATTLLLSELGRDERNEPLLERVAQHFEAGGKWDDASEQWGRLRRLFPDNKQALGGLVRSLRNANRWTAIEALLPEVKAEQGESVAYLELLSDYHRALGNIDEVVGANARILSLDAANYWAQYRLGDAQLLQGHLSDAKTSFEKAVVTNPQAPFAHERLAHIELRTGNVGPAIERLKETLARTPDHIWTIDSLARLQIAQGYYDAARALLSQSETIVAPGDRRFLDTRRAELDRNSAYEARIQANKAAWSQIFDGATLIDIGAADGLQWYWTILARAGLVKAIGFEPDVAECTALNSLYPFAKFYPHAVAARDGPTTFRITDVMSCSSLLEPDHTVLAPYPIRSCFQVVKRLDIEAKCLATILKTEDIGRVDFLKVDVQGAEFDVLQGMGDRLDGVLALELETQVLKIYEGQKTLWQIADFLATKGFRLRGLEPQGTFEGEVVEIEAFFAKDLDLLSENERRRVFLWEAIVGCPQMSFMADNTDLGAYPRLRKTLGERDIRTAALRREVRALVV